MSDTVSDGAAKCDRCQRALSLGSGQGFVAANGMMFHAACYTPSPVPSLATAPSLEALRVSFRGGPIEAFSEERVLMALHAALSHTCAGEGETENYRVLLGLHSALPLLLRDARNLKAAHAAADTVRESNRRLLEALDERDARLAQLETCTSYRPAGEKRQA